MSDLLKLENVNFSYCVSSKGTFSLDNISFTISDGDFVSVIGKNGSGKSTLIKLISRMYTNYRGEISYKSTSINLIESKTFSRNISYIPQTPGLISGSIKVEELLLLGRYPFKGLTEFRNTVSDREAVKACMKETGTMDFFGRDLEDLSGGEKQKVMLTLGLVQLNIGEDLKEKILLIDEPVTYLDVNFQMEIFRILKQLNDRGLTIIIVIHDLNSALNYTKKTLLMNRGRLAAFELTKKVITENMLKEHFQIESEIINYENKYLINFSV